jgi:hypothetical protein
MSTMFEKPRAKTVGAAPPPSTRSTRARSASSLTYSRRLPASPIADGGEARSLALVRREPSRLTTTIELAAASAT